MAKNLVIVESPTKAKILKKILGKDYAVESSGGHVRDLPEKKDHLPPTQRKLPYATLGIDVENGFKPLYVSPPAKKKTLAKLKEEIEDGTVIYLATDEDREGEAIAWHLNQILNPKGDHPIQRVVFHEITTPAIKEAFRHPRALDMDRIEAQQGRRILDRLVGYKLSPLIWKKIRFGLSAGRVQSAAVRIVVDREREIQKFIPEEYWSLTARLAKDGKEFEALLARKDGEKCVPRSQLETEAILAALRGRDFKVATIERKEVRKNPPPPFITSTLQQEASRKLGYPVKRTMQIAQRLYEGVELKQDGEATGLITYMRTDSVTLSDQALAESREVLGQLYGPEYQLEKPRTYRGTSKSAQEAHEAIRPTSLARTPGELRGQIEEEQLRLYELIWKRTLATQAPQVILDAVGADLAVGAYTFRATGQLVRFPGFMKIYVEDSDTADGREELGDKQLPELVEGEALTPREVTPRQHFTKPPAHYTEASLVRKMEEEGIGRPSTYAPTISTVIARGYVRVESRQLHPTDTAFVVNDFLVEHFPDIVDLKFTAGMEDDLDLIATGQRKLLPFLNGFYTPFAVKLEEKDKTVRKADIVNEPSDEICEQCSRPMVIKLGRSGKFLSCSGYPECKNARPLGQEGEERRALQEQYKGEKCETCASPMTVKSGSRGDFLACSRYPECKSTRDIVKSTGVLCPRCGAHPLVEKRSRFGMFWSCQGYPGCRFLSRHKPLRAGEPGRPGIYADKKGEEFFIPFDEEEYQAALSRSERRKKSASD